MEVQEDGRRPYRYLTLQWIFLEPINLLIDPKLSKLLNVKKWLVDQFGLLFFDFQKMPILIGFDWWTKTFRVLGLNDMINNFEL